MHDLISRQDAINALDEIESEVADGYGYQYEKWRKYFCELPSAQPSNGACWGCQCEKVEKLQPERGRREVFEQLSPTPPEKLTDKEQRIFLAAMEREEEVCKEVDRNYTREPYEDSLVRVCREITRKVKGALWT